MRYIHSVTPRRRIAHNMGTAIRNVPAGRARYRAMAYSVLVQMAFLFVVAMLVAVGTRFIGSTASIILGAGIILLFYGLFLVLFLHLIAPGKLMRKARRDVMATNDPALTALIDHRVRCELASSK